MTIRATIPLSLILLCLLALACGSDDLPPSDNRRVEDDRTPYARSMESKRDDVKDALARTVTLIEQSQSGVAPAGPGRASASPETQKPVIDKNVLARAIVELKSVGERLDEIAAALGAVNGTENSQKAINNVKEARTTALSKLSLVSNALNGSGEEPLEPSNLRQNLADAKKEIELKGLTQLSQIEIPMALQPPSSAIAKAFYDWAPKVGIALASFVALILLYVISKTALKVSAGRANARIISKLQPIASSFQKNQAEVASQISALTTSQNELRTRVADLEFELKRVARIAREAASNDGIGRRAFAAQPDFTTFEQPVAKDEPLFPISIGDYLSKMRRSSNIVRPDFQNDILVSDPGGTGELVLIRDTNVPDDLQPLFVVPRATQFQTKQDFYTYYQKYYECARPTAGDVWIIDPAVVSKVSGGWQLREKGVLEVR